MTVQYLVGDVFDRMADMAAGSVDLILTSPPFLALRSYLPADHPDKEKEIGSESTPAEYVDVLLRLTAEWRRLLAPHGSLCVELGDTYSGSGGAGGDYTEDGLREGQPRFAGSGQLAKYDDHRGNPDGMRDQTFSGANTRTGGGPGWPLAKSLTLIPEAYRFALAYGINPHTGETSPAGQWRVRNVIRWVRPNPPVGALGDKFRPATSELVVACPSSSRWFDLDAVRGGPVADNERTLASDGKSDRETFRTATGAPPLDWWDALVARIDKETQIAYDKGWHRQEGMFDEYADDPSKETPGQRAVRELVEMGVLEDGDVRRLSPGGYKGAHYAVWPSELCVKPIRAMCPEWVCRECGEPRRRITTEPRYHNENGSERLHLDDEWRSGRNAPNGKPPPKQGHLTRSSDTLGFTDCGHDNYRPGLVLDPFAGTGTTLAVAHGHSRDAIGIDLDPRNADLARDRVGPLFLEVVASPDGVRM
jgi:site-specific DNA-methyltransferase (adenine-specific)